jgi:predicted ArsR family transcriptional regulator
MVDLLRGVETVFGLEGLEKLLGDRTQRQIQAYTAKLAEFTDDWQARVAAIARLRSQEGYMAEVIEQPANVLLLVENHCPICAAARTCQKLCGSELEVFRTVLGATVTVERVEHILQGDRRCAYRIQQQCGIPSSLQSQVNSL